MEEMINTYIFGRKVWKETNSRKN